MFAISTSKIMVFALYMASAISVVLLSQREGVLAVVCMSLLIMSIMLRFSHSRVVNGEVAEKHLPNRESDVPQAFPSKLRADAQEFVPGKKWDRPNSTPKGSSATKADASGELGGAAVVFE
jgi:hypothetical protein